MKKSSRFATKKVTSYKEIENDEGAACKGESKRRAKRKVEQKNYNGSDTEEELYDHRDVVIEDTTYDRKKVVDASLLIRQVYLDTEVHYLKAVQDEFENVFLGALDEMPDNIHEKAWCEDCPDRERRPLVIQPMCSNYNNVKTSVTRLHPDRKTRQIVCSPITGRDKLPAMPYWIHIESNIAVEDNYRLTHVPYLDENQDDEKLCAGILPLFEEGIHGYSDNWRYINDWLLHTVLNNTLSKCMIPKGIVFFAFYQLFPNKFSHRKLPEVLEFLNNRWGGCYHRVDPAMLSSRYPTVLDHNKHSIDSVKCLQCKSYDCPIHGFSPEIPEKFKEGQWFRALLYVPPKNPKALKTKCSDECWKNIDRTTVLSNLGIRDEDLNTDLIEVYFSRSQLCRTDLVGGSGYIHCYSKLLSNFDCDAAKFDVGDTSFCEFIRSLALPKMLGTQTTCKKLYELILEHCHRPSKTRLYADRGKEKVDPSQMHKNFRTMTWQNGVGKIENNCKLIPCDHPGPCDQNSDCSCQQAGVCTKFCSCEDTCRQKFPGCRCKPGQCRTKQCQCFYAKWQCDPDVCKTCNCDKFGDKENSCRNSSIAKGYQKKIKVLPSKIAGWGAFIMEHAEKGELVSEYTGEIISVSEVERRGHVYDRFRTSYIFSLNDDEAVDAHKMGNLIRFANHSSKNMNCYPQILVVNGQHRIGIFAKQDLSPGDELLFDYSYNKQHKKLVGNDGVKPNKKSKNDDRSKRAASTSSGKTDQDSNISDDDYDTVTKPSKRAGSLQTSGATKKNRKR